MFEDEEYSNKPWGYHSENLELEKNEYLIVCVNQEIGYLGEFVLECHSDREIQSLCPFEFIRDSKYRYEIDSGSN